MKKVKSQKSKVKILNRKIIWSLVVYAAGVSANSCFAAEKITILYTGQTHASLYHCDCPIQPDGGLGRRMSKIKELRAQNPNIALVDAGGFFAGGALDQHAQDAESDKLRAEVHLQALSAMGYDGLNISDEEFNFGRDYLALRIKDSKIPFLSANLKAPGAFPYIIKKIGQNGIALIGLANPEAKAKSAGLEVEEAESALNKVIPEAKAKGANVIIVLSYLGEQKDRELLQKINDVDIVISGRPENSEESYVRVGLKLLGRASFQGRRLGKIDLELEEGKIKGIEASDIRLSDDVPDAPEIKKIVPECFSDKDCRKKGFIGKCDNAAKASASCSFVKPEGLSLLIVQPKDVKAPGQEKFIDYLKGHLPGIEVKFIDSGSKAGKSWMEKTQAKLLPIYLLAKEADKGDGFSKIKEFAELKEGYYYISPRLSGGLIFIGRQRIPGKLDVFLGARGKELEGALASLKELQAKHKDLKVELHYLAFEKKDGFSAPGGLPELEEDVRQLCLKKHNPDKFWDYALCRSRSQESTWWDICAEGLGIEPKVIKGCSLSEEGFSLLSENISLNKELEISSGPAYLSENNRIFATKGAPKVEELEKILKLETEGDKNERAN